MIKASYTEHGRTAYTEQKNYESEYVQNPCETERSNWQIKISCNYNWSMVAFWHIRVILGIGSINSDFEHYTTD